MEESGLIRYEGEKGKYEVITYLHVRMPTAEKGIRININLTGHRQHSKNM